MNTIRALAHVVFSLRLWMDTLFSRFWLKMLGVRVGSNLKSSGRPVIHRFRGSHIAIGARCEMSNRMASNILGLAHACMLSTVAENAKLIIGDDVGMSGVAICARQKIVIGNEVLLGANVLIVDNDFHPIAPESRRYSRDNIASAPISIGDRVFIGANATILKGVEIGEGSIIGAGSVVTGRIPPKAIAAGNPARVIGEIN
jgi:acetyltransferase-like isoleucine patch superfamily enzyme